MCSLTTQALEHANNTQQTSARTLKLAEKSTFLTQVLPLSPTHFTLSPIPYPLHTSPYPLSPIPYTLHPIPYTLHPIPYTLDPIPILSPIPFTLSTLPYPLHTSPYPVSYTLSPTHFTLNPALTKESLNPIPGAFTPYVCLCEHS